MSIVKLIHKALSDSDIRKILGNDTKIHGCHIRRSA